MGEVGIPLITSNRINMPEVAESVLADGCADMVSMARPFLADPHFVAKASTGRAAQIAPCIACNQACLDHTFAGKISTCLVNPRAGYETELVLSKSAEPKTIAVVGAGPAGLSTAISAAQQGHSVTLFEKDADIGGQLNMAKTIPGKEEFYGLVDWYREMLKTEGVVQKLATQATARDLVDFDEIVLATGVLPRDLDIPGIDHPSVVSYLDVLKHGVNVGEQVVVIGAGGIGFDVSERLVTHDGESPTEDLDAWLAEWGVGDPSQNRGGLVASGAQPTPPARNITLCQRKPTRPGKGLGKTTGWIHRAALKAKQVSMLAGVNYERIDDKGVHISFGDDQKDPTILPADSVVICAGQVSNTSLATELYELGVQFHVIGGLNTPLNLMPSGQSTKVYGFP